MGYRGGAPPVTYKETAATVPVQPLPASLLQPSSLPAHRRPTSQTPCPPVRLLAHQSDPCAHQSDARTHQPDPPTHQSALWRRIGPLQLGPLVGPHVAGRIPMQCRAAQRSAAQHQTTRHSTAQRRATQPAGSAYNPGRRSSAQHSTRPPDTAQNHTVRRVAPRRSPAQHSTPSALHYHRTSTAPCGWRLPPPSACPPAPAEALSPPSSARTHSHSGAAKSVSQPASLSVSRCVPVHILSAFLSSFSPKLQSFVGQSVREQTRQAGR